MANIVLNTKTYVGRGVLQGIATWMYATAGVLASWASVTAQVVLPKRDKEKAVVSWRLRLPVVADEASACACPGQVVDEIDAYIQVRATAGVSEAVRTDFALQLKDLCGRTEFQASIISFQQPTG